MNSASLCSPAGRYDNPIPTRCLAPIDCLKIPALNPAAERGEGGRIKEDIKEQPTPRNLSATATRVLRICTVAASRKYFSAIHTSPHLRPNPHTYYVNNIILHLLSVHSTAVNVQNKN